MLGTDRAQHKRSHARTASQDLGPTDTGAAAIAATRQHNPNVVLMDAQMPQLDGIETARRLIATGTRLCILMLTTFDLDEYVC